MADDLDPRLPCCQRGSVTIFIKPGVPNAEESTVLPCPRSYCPGCTIEGCGRPPDRPVASAALVGECRYGQLTRARWAGVNGPLTPRRQFLLLAGDAPP